MQTINIGPRPNAQTVKRTLLDHWAQTKSIARYYSWPNQPKTKLILTLKIDQTLFTLPVSFTNSLNDPTIFLHIMNVLLAWNREQQTILLNSIID